VHPTPGLVIRGDARTRVIAFDSALSILGTAHRQIQFLKFTVGPRSLASTLLDGL